VRSLGGVLRRLRALNETECYYRCYGAGDANVRVIRLERAPRGGARMTGEDMRSLFERLLDRRDPNAPVEPEIAA
jgi:hypothetical protein